MDIHNRTRYPALGFESVDNHGQAFHVVVARATLSIDSEGILHPTREQLPLVFSDILYGSLGTSSVKVESDLAPFKPKCDVVVIGNASSPGGSEVQRFEAGIKIHHQGKMLLDKRVMVTGPRVWKRSPMPFGGW